MPLIESTVNAMRSLFGTNGHSYQTLASTNRREEPDHKAMYGLLRDLYYNDKAYTEHGQSGMTLGFRNPTHAVVEFYPATTWPGRLPEALPIETDLEPEQSERLIAAIHQVWGWSNWSTNKQVYARSVPMLGDGLMKVATRSNANGEVQRVYKRIIEPDYLTDFDVDERGYLVYIRLDVPRQRRNGDTIEQYTHTEVWDKATGRYRVWEHTYGQVDDVAELGTPTRDEDMESFGLDFIPFVHSKHIDVGEKRGVAAVTAAIVKAHEADRMSSRLHQIMFQYGKSDMVLHSSLVDADGMPLPPPLVDDEGGEVDFGGSKLRRLPSGWMLSPLIADLPYDDHLNVLNAHLEHLQQTDLPELAYYRIADSRELSGKAIRFMLTAAIARAEEARGNREADDIRANQMALHIGQYHGLFRDIGDIGTFDAGDFNHRYRERSVVPLSEEEEALVAKARAEAAEKRKTYGWSNRALLKEDGVSEEDIEDMLAEVPSETLAGDVIEQPNNVQARELFDQAMNRGN